MHRGCLIGDVLYVVLYVRMYKQTVCSTFVLFVCGTYQSHLDVFYLWTDNSCHNFSSSNYSIVQCFVHLGFFRYRQLKLKLCFSFSCVYQVGKNVVQLNCLMKNCDTHYLSKDKLHPNQSSMSKNFYDLNQSHV